MTKTVAMFLCTMVATIAMGVSTPSQASLLHGGGKAHPVTAGSITFDDSYVDVTLVDDRRN